MADPATDPDAPTGRRHRRDERRRRRIRRVVAVVASAAVFALFVVLATDSVRFGGATGRRWRGPSSRSSPTTRARPSSTAVAARQCRTLSTADPLRLWVGGDSLAGSLGPALGTITGATGVVQPYFDSRVSSGLSSPGFFDWPEHATVEMARLDPEIVVFIIGTNDCDRGVGRHVEGRVRAGGRLDDEDPHRLRAAPSTGSGRRRSKDEKMDAGGVEVNAVAQEVAKRHPEVHYVDAYKLFSDTDGKYAGDLPDETGKVVTMRAGDGVHLTMDGADYLARTVYSSSTRSAA